MKKALGSSFKDEDTKVQGHKDMADLGIKTSLNFNFMIVANLPSEKQTQTNWLPL